MNFPINPAVGQEYNIANKTWIFNGKGWEAKSATLEPDYENLSNKPSINSVTLEGNKTAAQLGLATAAQGAKADTALQSLPAGIVIDADYNQFTDEEKSKLASMNYHYKGTYPSYELLILSVPFAEPGDEAIVDAVGIDPKKYLWDDTDGVWVLGSGTAITVEQAINEGSVNPVSGGAVHQALLGKANQSTETVYDISIEAEATADVHLAAVAELANFAQYDRHGNLIDTHYATQAELQVVEDSLSQVRQVPEYEEGSAGKVLMSGTSTGEYSWENLSGISLPIPITHSNLIALIENNGLVVGQSYLITDYRTTYLIPESFPEEIFIGDLEPLCVTASAVNELASLATSSLYPQDSIYYSAQDFYGQMEGSTKGFISRRVDNIRGNDMWFDFRNVRFRRWKVNVTWEHVDGNADSFPLYSVVKRVGSTDLFVKVSASVSAFEDTSSWFLLPFRNGNFVCPRRVKTWNIGLINVPVDVSSFMDFPIFSSAPSEGFTNQDIYAYNVRVLRGGNSPIMYSTNNVLFGSYAEHISLEGCSENSFLNINYSELKYSSNSIIANVFYCRMLDGVYSVLIDNSEELDIRGNFNDNILVNCEKFKVEGSFVFSVVLESSSFTSLGIVNSIMLPSGTTKLLIERDHYIYSKIFYGELELLEDKPKKMYSVGDNVYLSSMVEGGAIKISKI